MNIEFVHSYDLFLVVSSVAVAAFGGYVALRLVGRIPASRSRKASFWWLAAASAALGLGIWSMHFTGMLALRLPGPVGYDRGLTLLSVVIAEGVSLLALMVLQRERMPPAHLAGASVLMGGAIAGMHYTGMAAARFRDLQPDAPLAECGLLLAENLAGWVGGGSVMVLGIGLVAAVLDRQLHGRYAAELHETNERLQRLFDNSPVGIVLLSPRGELIEVNRALAEMLGYEVGQLEGAAFSKLTHPEDAERDVTLYRQLISGRINRYQVEKRYITRTGEVIWGDLQVAALRSPGAAIHAVGFVRDITDQRQLRERLEHRSLHDPLTGLPNRTLLADRIEQGLVRARRQGTPLGLFMLDVDHFKRVNDRLGHTAGDRVIIEVA